MEKQLPNEFTYVLFENEIKRFLYYLNIKEKVMENIIRRT
jgi:hypothetical protein